MNGSYLCNISVADEISVFIVMTGRERINSLYQMDKIFRFTCKQNLSVLVVPVEQRADTDRISGGNKGVFCGVIEYEGKFRVQERKHFQSEFLIKREKDFTVRVV